MLFEPESASSGWIGVPGIIHQHTQLISVYNVVVFDGLEHANEVSVADANTPRLARSGLKNSRAE